MSIKYKKKSHDFYIVAQSVEKVFHCDILLLYHSAMTMIIGYR